MRGCGQRHTHLLRYEGRRPPKPPCITSAGQFESNDERVGNPLTEIGRLYYMLDGRAGRWHVCWIMTFRMGYFLWTAAMGTIAARHAEARFPRDIIMV